MRLAIRDKLTHALNGWVSRKFNSALCSSPFSWTKVQKMITPPCETPKQASIGRLFAVGIDVGCEKCSISVLRPDKTVVIKPLEFTNDAQGYAFVLTKLESLGVIPAQITIGLEATGRYWENLYHYLARLGYNLILLHPVQTHQFAQRRGLRAKTDALDAGTIARVVLSDEARPAYVPGDLVATYRELVRLHSNLADEIGRYRNEIHALLFVIFPEYTQVFADPCRPTALSLYPSRQAIAEVPIGILSAKLIELSNGHYGLKTAERLLTLSKKSASSGLASNARAQGLVILCDQLLHTQANLEILESEIAQLLQKDEAAKKLAEIPEFGPKTIAGLRAELGEVGRFTNCNQVVAYAGLDLTVKESGKWKGKVKLSKRGSGRLRRLLYMVALVSLRLKVSAFGDYYRELRKRGMNGRSALMAVMRKMLITAYSLLKNDSTFDPKKVWIGAKFVAKELPLVAQVA
ncbi:IS110 family transposase [Candidatus Chlorohelix allophototropha]|uniref:IS110 family transposase n=2 Tax=Candidatus Chlorohelix allophototropha TaxID=3003348 RepID=A0ABY9B9Q9_9CHLR|nr:IS110 family transposase [Chloroflexota bacterium L227-S17]